MAELSFINLTRGEVKHNMQNRDISWRKTLVAFSLTGDEDRPQNRHTVEHPVANTSRKRTPLVSEHLSSATSHITIFGTSCKRPPLLSDRDHF